MIVVTFELFLLATGQMFFGKLVQKTLSYRNDQSCDYSSIIVDQILKC